VWRDQWLESQNAGDRGAGRVFCIASAGATAFRLADQHEVVACDINPAQLAYAERARSASGRGRLHCAAWSHCVAVVGGSRVSPISRKNRNGSGLPGAPVAPGI